ncbi:MAG: aminoacyl-tRNA hydrolase, partial [Candidatus Sericytochromatia bacterium]
MKLIVGLGNPGPKYTGTRHNAGFMVISRLAKEWNVNAKLETRLQAMVGEGRLDGEKVILAEPVTYMNLSGEAVAKLLSWYKLTPADLIVVYDEIAI